MTRHAFTLLELLVGIAIVALMVALLFPVWKRTVASGRATACVSNLRQLGVALNLYLAENGNTMPVMEAGRRSLAEDVPVIDNTLNRFVDGPGVFACPADDQNLAATTGTSYFWNSALNGQAVANLSFLTIDQQSRIPVLCDKDGFHPYEENRVNLLFADGHATRELKLFTGN